MKLKQSMLSLSEKILRCGSLCGFFEKKQGIDDVSQTTSSRFFPGDDWYITNGLCIMILKRFSREAGRGFPLHPG